ncbi:MAG TPA: nucleotidyltransferase domain-containing protein [Cyclobacteriaceae bacterium]|jgi:predicted nucleotidyltransferase|nr:nucleotidyltransferase domain-containing protein [Cyclobacteriaceae bacterium]HRE66216.1 nucleotidyltransferase domain-containing protein [Cyclobacteriaceae bacterium]HRF32093.1 nucleotidyltransferase domain-containing protein [Cyclobacteriaceae bacterium]
MAKADINEIKKYLEQCLLENGVTVNNIALFGSHLKGRPQADSDIDFVVISDSFIDKDLFERVKLIRGVERKVIQKFGVPLDILLKTAQEFDNMLTAKMIYAEVI